VVVIVMAPRRRYVKCRVAREEAGRLQGEARVFDGHDRPVLGPWIMGYRKRMPEHDVLPLKGAIR
jgi:hypothetical protein